MSNEILDADSIGPDVDLTAVSLPSDVGERLATFYEREERISDAQEWADVMTAAIREETGRAPNEMDMCVAGGGSHSVAFIDETLSYVCVLDPLIAVFLRGEPGTIRSETPDGNEVVIDVSRDGVTATPADAVLSVGVGDADREPTFEAAYGELCAYTHAFESTAAYERWDGRVDATTAQLSVSDGLALARGLVSTFG